MSEELRTTKERLSHAMVSGNLKVSANGVGDAEYLLGLGMAAIKANPAASSVMRLHLAHDVSQYKKIRNAVIKEAGRLNICERWGMANDAVRSIADAAMRHFIAPVCNKCLGQKYETIPGTPMLSGRPCRACKGTGERPIMEKYRKQIAGILNWLGRIEDDLEIMVRAKMRT